MLELLQANYRVKELQFRGYKKKDYKFRCSICANYYVYKKPFQKHEEKCRAAAEVDLDLLIALHAAPRCQPECVDEHGPGRAHRH
eukprot:g39597.t1